MSASLESVSPEIKKYSREPQRGSIPKPRVSEAPPWERGVSFLTRTLVGVPYFALCNSYRVGITGGLLFPGWLRDPGLRSGTLSACFSHPRAGSQISSPIKPCPWIREKLNCSKARTHMEVAPSGSPARPSHPGPSSYRQPEAESRAGSGKPPSVVSRLICGMGVPPMSLTGGTPVPLCLRHMTCDTTLAFGSFCI